MQSLFGFDLPTAQKWVIAFGVILVLLVLLGLLYCISIVGHIDPITNIRTVSMKRYLLSCLQTPYALWDQFFLILPRSVVVRTTSDQVVDPVGSMVRQNKHFRSSLGCRIRIARIQPICFLESPVYSIAVHFIGANLNKKGSFVNLLSTNNLKKIVNSNDVAVNERVGIVYGVVNMGFCRKIYYYIT